MINWWLVVPVVSVAILVGSVGIWCAVTILEEFLGGRK